jgi:hypothetical protein
MVAILKTFSLPLLFILPWVLMKAYGWDKGFQENIVRNPLPVILILLPSILLTIWRIVKK